MEDINKKVSLKDKCGSENGIVLIVTVALLAVLTLVGTIVVNTTNMDIKISNNYKTKTQSFYASEAGTEEARARLRGKQPLDDNYAGDTSTPANGSWTAYILTSSSWQSSDDPDYDDSYLNYFPANGNPTDLTIAANSIVTAGSSYWVKIRHKKETDVLPGELYTDNTATADDIIYYGYATPTSTTLDLFTTNATPYNASPVEIIKSYGNSNSKSFSIIETQVRKGIRPPIVSALYGDIVQPPGGGGGHVTVIGNDNCSTAPALPAVGYTTQDDLTSAHGSGVTITSDAGQNIQITPAIDVTSMVDSLESEASETLTSDQSSYTVGSPSNYVTVYCNATILGNPHSGVLDFSGTTIGYGTLVVRGSLEIGGSITWYGIILATGNVKFSGGGTRQIFGAVLSQSTATVGGTVDIQYDSCQIENANSVYSYSVSSWKDERFD